MTGIVRSAVDHFAASLQSAEGKLENAGNTGVDRLGDAIFGQTAESATKNAPVVAPDASTIPTTHGRRTLRSDGQDPFRDEDNAISADKS